jgi:hypothetical protein
MARLIISARTPAKVVHLQPKNRPDALAIVEKALRDTFTELALQHGAYTVTTAAHRLICEAIERARLKHRPNEDAWIQDLITRFEQSTREVKHRK